MNIVIPAAGAGSRFKHIYTEPKPYITVDNMPMIVLAVKTLGVQGTYLYILPEHKDTHTIINNLKEVTPSCLCHTIDYVTEGAVQSALLFEQFINNDEELIIANCDQVMHRNLDFAIDHLRKYDAGLVTIYDDSPKHSYAVTDREGLVRDVVEKQVVSTNALTGIHYWKRGKDFVSSAKRLIDDDNRSLNEFYISTTYNYLIKDGLSVGHFMIDEDEISFIGTPEDLKKYNER